MTSAKPARASPASTGKVEGIGARRSALRMIDAVLRRGEPLDQAMHAATHGLASDDRAFAVAIASECLRWLVAIDALIDAATPQPLAPDTKARAVLQLALTQLLILGTPAHAVVSTALPLVVGGPRRLVHALLSRAQREGWTLPSAPPLPTHVAQRWQSNWGDAMVADATTAWRSAPPLDLSFANDAAAIAFGDGAALAPRHRRVARGGAIEKLPGFESGEWWVQDLAATLPVRLLGDGRGRSAFDLCAAPGGKTMQLAAAGWTVTAVDSSARRLERLQANLDRTRLAAQLIAADVRAWQPAELADAILLDAPCSATGIFRRHPDVLHRVESADIAPLAALQAELIERSSRWVKPGGTLVFATCSLEPAEGEEQITRFLAQHPDWTISPPHAGELPDGLAAHANGWVRTLPGDLAGAGGLDGFFVVRLVAPSTGS